MWVKIRFIFGFLIFLSALHAQNPGNPGVQCFSAAQRNAFRDSIAETTRQLTQSQTAKLYCKRARYNINLNKYDSALTDLKIAIKLDSTYQNAYANLGLTLIHLNKCKDAVSDLLKVLDLDSTNNWTMACLGEALRCNGDYISALNYLNRAFKKDTSDNFILECIAYCYMVTDSTDKALTLCNWGIERYPSSYSLYWIKAQIYEHRKEYGLAIDYCTKFLVPEKDSTNVCPPSKQVYSWVYGCRGYCYHSLNQKKLAIADYTEAIKNDSSNTQALYNRGLIYEYMGRYARARNDFYAAALIGYSSAIDALRKNYYDLYEKYMGEVKTTQVTQ